MKRKRKSLCIYVTTQEEAGVKIGIMVYDEILELWPLLQAWTQTSGEDWGFFLISLCLCGTWTAFSRAELDQQGCFPQHTTQPFHRPTLALQHKYSPGSVVDTTLLWWFRREWMVGWFWELSKCSDPTAFLQVVLWSRSKCLKCEETTLPQVNSYKELKELQKFSQDPCQCWTSYKVNSDGQLTKHLGLWQ